MLKKTSTRNYARTVPTLHVLAGPPEDPTRGISEVTNGPESVMIQQVGARLLLQAALTNLLVISPKTNEISISGRGRTLGGAKRCPLLLSDAAVRTLGQPVAVLSTQTTGNKKRLHWPCRQARTVYTTLLLPSHCIITSSAAHDLTLPSCIVRVWDISTPGGLCDKSAGSTLTSAKPHHASGPFGFTNCCIAHGRRRRSVVTGPRDPLSLLGPSPDLGTAKSAGGADLWKLFLRVLFPSA